MSKKKIILEYSDYKKYEQLINFIESYKLDEDNINKLFKAISEGTLSNLVIDKSFLFSSILSDRIIHKFTIKTKDEAIQHALQIKELSFYYMNTKDFRKWKKEYKKNQEKI